MGVIHIKRQILVVNEDLAVGRTICDSMEDEVTTVCYMTSAMEALADYIKNEYCLVILDVQITDTNSVELLRIIRNTKHTPILVLTDPLTPEDIVTLFHAGADACLEKPLNIEVCAAQANALIKLYIESDINHNQYKPVVHGSEFMISPRYRQVMIDGKPLALTRREFDLLHCLASSPKQVFTCEQLYNHVWGDDSVVAVDDIVKSQIKRLQKNYRKLGKITYRLSGA